MKRTLILVTALTGFSAVPVIAMAEQSTDDAALLAASSMTVETAGQNALKAIPGKLMAIGLNDEDGRGVFEATIVADDGQVWMVKLDAANGEMLGMGLASLMDDGGDGGDHEGDGETGDEGGTEQG